VSEAESLAFNSAGDLFVANYYGDIYEYTPAGVQSFFASVLAGGVYGPIDGLAFNGAGDLFATTFQGGTITEITPGGVQSTFASGFIPQGLAFNSAGNLFAADFYNGNIYEYTPGGVQSTFASGLSDPEGLAFQGVTLPVPEPSALGLLALGVFGLTLMRRHQR
jgi:DNA-binding beta-propeller fold protein YncE